jgi:very-short-patch-repair endonuclease
MLERRFGFHLLVKQIAEEVADLVTEFIEETDADPDNWWGDTKIEKLFFLALDCYLQFIVGRAKLQKSEHAPSLQEIIETRPSVWIRRQVEIEDVGRVDFVIYAHGHWGDHRPQSVRALVIECDGHDYHERTKEQAAKDRSRDRAVQMKGYDQVFRYTGSELWCDPLGCAQEVYEWVQHGWLPPRKISE